MKEEIKEIDISFDYDKNSADGLHCLIYRAIKDLKAYVDRHVAGKNKYACVLSNFLSSLADFANEEKAEFIRAPLCDNLAYLEHEADPGKIKLKEKWSEGIWRFQGGVFVATMSFLHSDYEQICSCTSTFIIAPSKKAATDLIERYHRAEWARTRQVACVLSYSGERIDDFRKMKWEDIHLQNNMVADIRTEIETFFKNEEAYKKYNLEWKRGMMLAGRPGNGKTALARAIATTSKVPVIYCALDSDDMFRILDRVERTIRANAPCIVIFEDADTLGSNPALRSAMLNMLDGLFTTKGVFTIATTNAPEKLDEAFTGRPSRFDSFYIISDPQPKERMNILMDRLGNAAKHLKGADMKELIKEMSGLSAACVQEIAVCALLQTMKTGKPLDMKTLHVSLEKIKKHMRASSEGVDRVMRGSIGFASKVRGPSYDEW